MKLIKLSGRPARSGYILLVTLAFLTVALIAYASLMYWVSTNSKITKRNILFNQSQAAAESATESIIAAMIRDFSNQSLNSASAYSASTNLPSQVWPISFQFSDTNGNVNTASVSESPLGWFTALPGSYTNLSGLGQICNITAVAAPQNVGENLSAKISQSIWFGSIPVFQFAIFYNLDLEINPGSAMTINGRVHSNNNIYATGSSSGSPLTFSDVVEASQQVNKFSSPLDPRNPARTGNDVFQLSGQPLSNVNSLSLPIGTNNNPSAVLGVLGIPPANVVPASPAGQSYPYNQADLIITNAPSGTNIAVYYQNLNNANPQTLVPMDVTNIILQYITNANLTVSTSYVTNTYYSFVTNATFYDYRESDTVQAIQIDVGMFGNWLTNAAGGLPYNNQNTTGGTSKGHNIDGVYVYNSVPLTSSQLPAVRVVNGAKLPTADGFTVATQFPIYVQGSYNTTTNNVNYSTKLGDTTNTWPAALMGDAVTILSANWSDAYNANTQLSSRAKPGNTTINAACLEGIVPSNGTQYSGGVENFLRLLEDWGGVTLGYNGSIVVLYPSQYATGFWNGNVYGVPTRQWGFDTNFKQQNRLPPMTPQVRAIIRSSWAAQ
jgi:hypothetical protein